MKRLGTLVMAILLITGCNAMQPNMEEAGLLWPETEKNIQKWAWDADDNASPTETPKAILDLRENIPQEATVTVKWAASEPQEAPTPEPDKSGQEGPCQPEQATPRQEETPEVIDWPLFTCPPEPTPMQQSEWPIITCPPAPTSTPAQEWPYITAPEPPTYTPEPEPMEPPQEESTPTPPPVPVDPVVPIPESTTQPAAPDPEQPAEQPSTGYAECSCGARLTPEELVSHMKAHAMNGEDHSYRAY